MPVPQKATVPPPAANAPRWAAASMPAAMPETTEIPRSDRLRPKSWAMRSACGVAWRLPTMATDGRCSNSMLPRTNSIGGGVMPSDSMTGKSSSHNSSRRQFSCSDHFSAASAACSASPRRFAHASCAALRTSTCRTASASACHTAVAVPKWRISCRKVSAPMCGISASRSQSWRSCSVVMPFSRFAS